MASFDYESMRTLGVNLLTQFGNPFVLKKAEGKPVYDEVQRKNIQPYKDYTGICIMRNYLAEATGEQATLISAGDTMFICSFDDETVVPTETKDKIEFKGTLYNVLEDTPVNPSGDKYIVHKIFAKRVN